MDDLSMMSPAMLLENFRQHVTQAARSEGWARARMSRQADMYEQEIVKRMAW